MKVARIALVIVALGLATATPARADFTVGSLLQTVPSEQFSCVSGCTVAPTIVPGNTVTAPFAGLITRWRIRNGDATSSTRLQVIHRGIGTAVEVRHSAEVTAPANATTGYETRIPIAAGDAIAVACVGTCAFVADDTGTAEIWNEVLSTTPLAPATFPFEVLINADIEADSDLDEFGDESQDNCVGVANPSQADRDHDGVGDACDVCPDVSGPAPRGCPVVASPPPKPNQPPTARFRTPRSGTVVGPSVRIELDAADDRGVPLVTVFDDDGTICVLRAAPYACTWNPTGADVGRATLLASAVDSAGLSSLAIVRVRVGRFAAVLSKPKAKRSRGRLRVTGRLVLPAAVTRAQGCSGDVTVRVRKAKKTVPLSRRCRYAAALKVRTGRARVSFAGNSVIAPT
jgi:hypothetical protein